MICCGLGRVGSACMHRAACRRTQGREVGPHPPPMPCCPPRPPHPPLPLNPSPPAGARRARPHLLWAAGVGQRGGAAGGGAGPQVFHAGRQGGWLVGAGGAVVSAGTAQLLQRAGAMVRALLAGGRGCRVCACIAALVTPNCLGASRPQPAPAPTPCRAAWARPAVPPRWPWRWRAQGTPRWWCRPTQPTRSVTHWTRWVAARVIGGQGRLSDRIVCTAGGGGIL